MIPFIDLQAQHQSIRPALDQALAEVIDSGRFIGGPFVERFERAVADYVGTRHAIGVSSGTDALLASLMALGVGPGDEVITTPFTFCASAEAILRVGAEPVFVDIDPATFNMDVGLLEEAVGERTRAILAVHLYGQTCSMDEVLAVAQRHDLFVVEDCAQAMGARYQTEKAVSSQRSQRTQRENNMGQSSVPSVTSVVNSSHGTEKAVSPQRSQRTQRESNMGQSSVPSVTSVVNSSHGWTQAGAMGDVGCFSFFPTKNLGGLGDGGMITCDDDQLAGRIRQVCHHGCQPKHHQRAVGGNFRLDALQAAVLAVKLPHLDGWLEARRAGAKHYDEALGALEGVVAPLEADGCWHTYNQYTVRVSDRDAVCARLKAADIGFGVYYRMGLHQQEAYAGCRCVPERLDAVERVCDEVVSLPVMVHAGDAHRVANTLAGS